MTDTEPTIRLGVPADLDELMALAMMATEENAFVRPSPAKMATMIWGALTQQNGLVGVISDDPHVIQGAVLLTFGETWYSDVTILEERAIFIHPEYRAAKGGLAKRLAEFTKKTADTLNNMPLIIGVVSNERTAAKCRMYERMFPDEKAGVFFLHNARTGEWN